MIDIVKQSSEGPHLDCTLECLVVDLLVGTLDVGQVDLGAAHDDPDERRVVRAHPVHRLVQTPSEEVRLVLHALDCNTREVVKIFMAMLCIKCYTSSESYSFKFKKLIFRITEFS